MSISLPCHFLVGVPASGKSHFAEGFVKRDPSYVIVSTDAVREKLYGDAAIQGDWLEIEAEVLAQIRGAIAQERPVIYDATNVRRAWRLGFLQSVKALSDPPLTWMAWVMEIPVEVCKRRNRDRHRVVPGHIIERMAESLAQTPVTTAEGFLDVRSLPLTVHGDIDFSQVFKQIEGLPLRLVRRRNRNSQVVWHPYGSLLEFERLMFLISYLLKRGSQAPYPSLSEIVRDLSRQQGQVYADEAALGADLNWLRSQGFFAPHAEGVIEIETAQLSNPGGLIHCHRYSDRQCFLRLMETIRAILQHPFENHADLTVQESLVTVVNRRQTLSDRVTLRKDIELALYPYEILDRQENYRSGYYLGTSIFSLEDLTWLHQQLQGQAEFISRPEERERYYRMLQQIERLHPSALQSDYPIWRFGNPSIIQVDGLVNVSLARRRGRIEEAIRDRELLSLEKLQGTGEFPGDPVALEAYPLQLIFHHIAWYVGWEAKADGLLSFERLDRWYLRVERTQVYRDRPQHQQSLKRLQQLHEASVGGFLGRSAQEQAQYLDRAGGQRAATVLVELWCNDASFRFIREGTQRFPLQQMRMSNPEGPGDRRRLTRLFSAKKTDDPDYPHRFQVRLPCWSLDDIDLRRWILGFGGQVRVMSPPRLRQMIQETGGAIVATYEP